MNVKSIKTFVLPIMVAFFIFILISASISLVLVNSVVKAFQNAQGKVVTLYCDGTYTDTKINLHIWSENMGEPLEIPSNSNATSGKVTVSENIARSAESLAWPEGTPKSIYKGNNSNVKSWSALGKSAPTKAFQKAMDKWYPNHWNQRAYRGHYGARYGMCCCHFVKTTVSVVTGRQMPNSLSNINSYARYGFSIKTYYYSNDILSKLQRGDICTVSGHTFIYLGGNRIAEGGLISCTSGVIRTKNVAKYIKSKGKVFVARNNSMVGALTSEQPLSNVFIDFTVSGSKSKENKACELRKMNIDCGYKKGNLLSLIRINDDGTFVLRGTLLGNAITLKGTASNGKIKGKGIYSDPDIGSDVNQDIGDITFTGAEELASTPLQKRVAKIASSGAVRYRMGYCELYVSNVYAYCGLHYNGSCCARKSRDKNAVKKGNIPVGAAIYSGNKYRSSINCECGRNAGHVAIYIGNNKVSGAQTPKIMSLKQWINLFGYGGYYLPSN